MKIIYCYQVPKGFCKPAGADNRFPVILIVRRYIFHLHSFFPEFRSLCSVRFVLFCFVFPNGIRLKSIMGYDCKPVSTVYTMLASSWNIQKSSHVFPTPRKERKSVMRGRGPASRSFSLFGRRRRPVLAEQYSF